MVTASVLGWPRVLRSAATAASAVSSGRSARWLPGTNLPFVLVPSRSNSASTVPASHVSYWHQPGSEPLLPLTLGQVAERAAAAWPEREAVVAVHQGRRLTFSQVLEQADKLAAALLRIGLQPGDMLGLCGPNSMEWYITNLAATRAGLILVNINPAYQTQELEYCLAKSGAKALVIPNAFRTQNYIKMLENIAPEFPSSKPGQLKSKKLPYLRSLITISDSELPGAFWYEDLINSTGPSEIFLVQQLQKKIQFDSGCNLQFTSGTTGQPKGTLLSHHNVVNNAYFSGKRLKMHQKHHRICLQVPLFHCFGNVLGIAIALHCGSTIVLPSHTFRAEESIKAINEERCSVIYGTPTMYIDVISKSQENPSSFSSLELAVVAGAPATPELFHKVVHTLSVKKFYSVYGMTETSPLSFVPDSEDSVAQCSNRVGKVMDHVEVKVVDTDGRMVPMGHPGELLVRGYGNMLCYYNDEEKTTEIVGTDRWLRTGDQFVLHKDGYGEVVGRIKDMIIRGGENIFPKEIEDYLAKHQDIVDAQVLGVPDERLGEELCACIRLKPGSKLSSDEVKDFCRGKIAHFKIPKYIKFMEDYPRTQSGKIQKFKLRELILAEGLNF